VIFTLLLAKKIWIKIKRISLCSKHIICLQCSEVFPTCFKIRCQMVTPSLYFTCMMVWFTVTPSINSIPHVLKKPNPWILSNNFNKTDCREGRY